MSPILATILSAIGGLLFKALLSYLVGAVDTSSWPDWLATIFSLLG